MYRMLTLYQGHIFYIFGLFSLFINNKSLYNSFGFHNEFPIIIGFLLFSDALAASNSESEHDGRRSFVCGLSLFTPHLAGASRCSSMGQLDEERQKVGG